MNQDSKRTFRAMPERAASAFHMLLGDAAVRPLAPRARQAQCRDGLLLE